MEAIAIFIVILLGAIVLRIMKWKQHNNYIYIRIVY